MYKTILVPLDGSDLAELALPYAKKIARAFNARIHLVSAIKTNIGVEIPIQIEEEARQDIEGYLQRIVDSLPPELGPSIDIKIGYPAEVIVDEAKRLDKTLIVMSTRGYSGLRRMMLGSIAHKVVEVAEAPVMLIPADAKNPDGGPVQFERTIVPLDGSPLAEKILPSVVEFCDAMNMEMILVRIYNPIFPGSSVRMHEISEIVHDAAENYIKGKAMELRELTGREIKYHVVRGIPSEQIVDLALQTSNSITAMCTHGRHGPGRWLLGGVTDAVIRSSQEPVLVIRGLKDND